MKLRISIVAALLLLFMPVLVFAQGEDVEPTNMEYIALMFNIGIVGAAVQLLKWKLLPILKKSAPYAIPLIGMAIGTASAWVLKTTGIDILPIGNIFEMGIVSGAFASSGFAVLKEFGNKFRPTASAVRWSDGSRLGLVLFLFFALGTAPASAQELDLKDLAVGGGSAFGEEGETFNTSALFGAVQWQGLKLPMNSSTGVALEFSAQPNAEGENEFTFTMWSLNRADVGERFFAGTDMKILENRKTDFDLRVVAGVLLGTIRERELVLEIYSLEEDRPISFGIFYRF